MGPEGELRIDLRLQGDSVQRVEVHSTRPDVAGRVLQGRTRAEIGAAVPLLFSICGRSQAAASELACAAAAGETLDAAALQRCSVAVAAETMREGAWRTLLDWPLWIGEKPSDEAVAAARASLALAAAAPPASAQATRTAIANAVFGAPAVDWLALDSAADLARWADAGQTAAARFIRRVRDDEAAAAARAAPARQQVTLLQHRDHPAWVGQIVQAADADRSFARHPTWRGAPAETGALARLQAEPLLGPLAANAATRVQARFVARLRELALLLAARSWPAVGALALSGQRGVSWVETARGLLIHQVGIHQDCVRHYRIVAPTEWNFHPQGALALALSGEPAADVEALQQRAKRLVQSLDPCVACRVEVTDA